MDRTYAIMPSAKKLRGKQRKSKAKPKHIPQATQNGAINNSDGQRLPMSALTSPSRLISAIRNGLIINTSEYNYISFGDSKPKAVVFRETLLEMGLVSALVECVNRCNDETYAWPNNKMISYPTDGKTEPFSPAYNFNNLCSITRL